MPLLQQFRALVKREQLFTTEDRLLVACSGGLDSTVLVHLLHAEGYDFGIVHMNFQLRGEASDGDAAFVKELARTLDAEHVEKAVATKSLAQSGESIQMTARRLRYEYFEVIMDEYNYTHLLTAHHFDDNFETVLINLIRGTGIHGMTGIAPLANDIARPLLNSTRQDLLDYATANNLSWREDASNATDDYLRNRVRHHLVPLLKDEFGMQAKGIQATIGQLRQAESVYDYFLNREKRQRKSKSAELTCFADDPAWPQPVRLAFVYKVMSAYGFTGDQTQQIARLADNSFLDNDRHRAYRTEGQWQVGPIPDDLPLESITIRAADLPICYRLNERSYCISLDKRPPLPLSDYTHRLIIAPPKFPLHLRPRQMGDRIQPLGMHGKSKKLKDYFIDRKIPVWRRDRLYLLTDADGVILAIPGMCITEAGKVADADTIVMNVKLI